ncbi:MAG: C1 family peptidase [Bacteriovoracaceae bacterium]|nr:C1 family peptidase [Bacteriovoracaceae bacterium]
MAILRISLLVLFFAITINFRLIACTENVTDLNIDILPFQRIDQNNLPVCGFACDMPWLSHQLGLKLDVKYYFFKDLLYRVFLRLSESAGISIPQVNINSIDSKDDFIYDFIFHRREDFSTTSSHNEFFINHIYELGIVYKQIENGDISLPNTTELFDEIFPLLKILENYKIYMISQSSSFVVGLKNILLGEPTREKIKNFVDFLNDKNISWDLYEFSLVQSLRAFYSSSGNLDLIYFFYPLEVANKNLEITTLNNELLNQVKNKIVNSKEYQYSNQENETDPNYYKNFIERIESELKGSSDSAGSPIRITIDPWSKSFEMPENGYIMKKADFVKYRGDNEDKHLMNIVGYKITDETYNGTKIPILKIYNSYGLDWGINGYIYVKATPEILDLLQLSYFL